MIDLKYTTEDAVERAVERMVDRLDAEYMSGAIQEPEYVRKLDAINSWADANIREILASARANSLPRVA